MPTKPYGLICPITHASEVLEPRWTIPILVEMWGGSTRFNDIRRGVGNISTALLSRRLKRLAEQGMIERIEDPATGQIDYIRTQRAVDLEPALDALGKWAQCNIEAMDALENLTVSNLMWQMRNYIDRDQLPSRQLVFQFRFTDPSLDYDKYWALMKQGFPAEICTTIPDFEVDLFIETTCMSLSSILLNRTTIPRELESGRLFLSGDAMISRTMQRWFYQSTKVDRSKVPQLKDDWFTERGSTIAAAE
jgi:DNA-binding HxlR family transcriptional regulator